MQKHLHILGICGTFMGGVARIARQLGFKVTGSDHNIYPPMSNALAAQDIQIMSGYEAAHLCPRPDKVLFGNVCKRGVPAVEAVLNESIPFASGPAWLAENVLHQRHVLAVAGTHGKTTTTSMLTWILTCAGLKPGYLIGGVSHNLSHTANLGDSPYFVIEADEYDTAFFDKRPKFLHYFPNTLVLNNLEFDHADIYPNVEAIEQQFHFLIRTVAPKGQIIYPQKDFHLNRVLARGAWSGLETFIGPDSRWQARLHHQDASFFEVFFENTSCGHVKWRLWGEHNVENALAAIVAAQHVGISPKISTAALCEFEGVKRRLEIAAEINGITLYDDFAHHPTAIEKTLKALRSRVAGKKIIAVLQFGSNTMRSGGHTDECLAKALQEANQIILFNNEEKGGQLQKLQAYSSSPMTIFSSVDTIIDYLKNTLVSQDQVLIMSNKGFDGLQKKLTQALQQSVSS